MEKKCSNCKVEKRRYGSYCSQCNKIKAREWYNKNREYKINMTIKNLQINNYAYEKTPEQREIRKIKALTRYHFPLDGELCKYCNDNATEHHHNTNPIQVDKFEYVCHNCHMEQEIQKGVKIW